MRPDTMAQRLSTPTSKLTNAQAVDKMVILINIFHSIDQRYGTEESKEELRQTIRSELKKLERRVGSALATNYRWYLNDLEAWNAVKESFLR